MTSELTSGQRKYLRGLAHHLEAVVLVGKQGLSESLVAAASGALDAHELIKVRFNEHKDQKKELTAKLAEETSSQVAGIIGHVAILYRPHPEAEKRRIKLPGV
jgi:RNA-binding protein